MPLYNYKCPECGKEIEALVRKIEPEQYCYNPTEHGEGAIRMQRVLGTPSAPQWKCGAAHSRSKGF